VLRRAASWGRGRVSVLAASERINPEAFNSPEVEAQSTRLELCIRTRCLLRRMSPHRLVPPRWPKCWRRLHKISSRTSRNSAEDPERTMPIS